MKALDKRPRKRRWLTMGGLVGAAFALWYLLRLGGFGLGGGAGSDGEETKASRIDAAIPTDAADKAAALPPCRIVINSRGLLADGAVLSIEEVVSACKKSHVVELVVAGDATTRQVEETSAALRAAGMMVTEAHKQPE